RRSLTGCQLCGLAGESSHPTTRGIRAAAASWQRPLCHCEQFGPGERQGIFADTSARAGDRQSFGGVLDHEYACLGQAVRGQSRDPALGITEPQVLELRWVTECGTEAGGIKDARQNV